MSEKQHRARKRFGQNFLTDTSVIRRIIGAINPQATDNLVEIGPGQGALTRPLMEQINTLKVIEIDHDLVQLLTQLYPALDIHVGDALKYDFSSLYENNRMLRVVGNLPYNISTPLIFHLLKSWRHIEDMHFMLQKELVERMAAGPGSKTYGRLSVMSQYYCAIDHLFDVPPHAFSPAPKVMSAIVRLRPHREIEFPASDLQQLDQVVKLTFGQRRKTLRNSLKSIPDIDIEKLAQTLDLDLQLRPEQLPVADFIRISNQISALKDQENET